ncbi:MAG: monovalent cation:proton antiporter-2 (CPA2) family protein [Pseudomonadota bacterium]|nr:monovalent cation:proton antiporter-2 (CPA2) family protein [Pseudomonadota bacterium]
MGESALDAIIILLVGSVIAVAVFRRLRFPSILAYLLVGLITGPHGLAWIPHTDDTHFLAEFGIVFLLFSIGLEFSMARIASMKKEVLGLGGAQVVVTTILAGTIAWLLGLRFEGAIVVGGVLAMSSTAIVIKQLKDQQELGLPHGRLSIAILLFQDIAVVPFLIMIPVMAGSPETSLAWELAWALGKGLSVIALMLAVGWWVLRPLFGVIVSSRSSELFTLTALLFAMAAAWLSHFAGLSFALGAFLAGMILGETEFRHQIEADIRPFRDVLLGLFFVTIGMMLDVHGLPVTAHWVLLLVAALILFKTAVIAGLSLLFGSPAGAGIRTGVVLAQGGEFGLALLMVAFSDGLLETGVVQIVLAAVIISMALTPVLISCNGAIRNRLCSDDYSQ